MDIRDLRFFCLTAELEHVTRAADKLGVAQPFLTKIIGQMEDEVGIALFDNVGRKIKLNKYGEVVYRHGKKILSQLENLHDDLDAMIESQSYTINITTNGEFHYPELFMAFHMSSPDYTLSFAYSSREEAFSALRTGETDFVICSPPLDDVPERGVKTEVIFKEYACFMLPPEHPLLKLKRPVGITELSDLPLVATAKESALRINIERVLDKYDYHPQIICESNDIGLILRMVKSGLGFAILPRTAMFSMPSIRKYCLECSMPDAYGEIGLSYPQNGRSSLDGSNFISFTKTFVNSFFHKHYKSGIAHLLQD